MPVVQARNPRWDIEITTQRNLTIGSEELGKEILDFTVTSQMGSPASSFQIVMRPSPAPARLGPNLEWADVISPMDFVTISAWVPPRAAKFPLIRGFVDTVGTVSDFSSGKPRRQVVIAGRNYGKLLLTGKFYYPHEGVQQTALLAKWRATFDDVFGYGAGAAPNVYPPSPSGKVAPAGFSQPGEFMQILYSGFYAPYEATVIGTFPDSSRIPSMGYHALLDDWEKELVAINPIFIMENSVPYSDLWTMFRGFQHHPWRELFIREESLRPLLVYRPTPWLNAFGDKVQDWDPETVRVHEIPDPAVDPKTGGIVSGAQFRSDEEVKNFFITLPTMTGDLAQAVKQFSSAFEAVYSQPLFKSNPWLIGFDENDRFLASAYQRYGFRLHETISPFFSMVDRAAKENEVKDSVELVRRWSLEGNKRLVAALGHADTLENGYLLIAGDERIRHGDYLKYKGSHAYIAGLTHHFKVATAPQDGLFQTRINFIRSRRLIDHLSRDA